MPKKSKIEKFIVVDKHKFILEIYPHLVSWEIFPYDYKSSLYAFSNKEKLNNIVETKYVFAK